MSELKTLRDTLSVTLRLPRTATPGIIQDGIEASFRDEAGVVGAIPATEQAQEWSSLEVTPSRGVLGGEATPVAPAPNFNSEQPHE